MASDFTKLPFDIIVDLINADNATSLVKADLTFSAITVLGSGNRNTQVTITAVGGSGYTGTRDLTYDRIDLATVPGSRSVTFPIGSATNAVDLIPAINAAYQLNLQVADYDNDPLPTFTGTPDETHPFTLNAKAGSYIFRGSVNLIISGNDVDLADAITVTELNGLTYPAA